jgi:hypothetical protein
LAIAVNMSMAATTATARCSQVREPLSVTRLSVRASLAGHFETPEAADDELIVDAEVA